jgi:alpha-glucosidase
MNDSKTLTAFALAFGPACLVPFALIGRGAGEGPESSFEVPSPSGDIAVEIVVADELTYSVTWRGRPLVTASPVSMTLEDGTVIGPDARVVDSRHRTVDEEISLVVPEKFARIRDHYEELTLDLTGGWGLDVRAYDDGVAYRFRTSAGDSTIVAAEELTATFEGNPLVWFPTEESFLTHSERVYWQVALSEIPADSMAHLPVLVAFPDGPKVAVTEADLRDYPGMYLTGSSANSLTGMWPEYPTAEEQVNDRTVRVTERGEFLARTDGNRTFPWRVLVIAESDGDLIESTMVFRLAQPLQIEDPSWIRPGKVAWDWWNALNLQGVDFEAGVNTATYRYFIDFAADHGIEYVILDEGWSDPADLSSINPQVDVQALLSYGRERGVGLILWVVWKSLEDRFEESLDSFAEWGVAGIKVDFMQRDDQRMVNYYWRVAEAAAERELLVDFHGAYKPAGLRRAYPNVLTREGVRGLEWSKWSEHPTPEHNVTLPFTRMLAGPMDYTPGAMLNAQESQFHPVFDRPMSMGTRVHQLAMYVVFESPLQMLSDSPSNYLRELECLRFMVDVPTVWDETRVLSAEVGDWVAVARRRGEVWYVGAMTDWTERDIQLDLSFLGDGTWSATIFEDGVNAGRSATDYRRLEREVTAGESMTVHLATGGGWVGRFEQ